MKIIKKANLPLDQFIDCSLYDKNSGYYMKKNPFGEKGDFITAPNISRLFSEMIAIWVVSFWQNLGSPKKFNIVELGAGNGEMMKILIDSFKNFPDFFKSCNFFIYEKSTQLITLQKKNIKHKKILWLKNLKKFEKIKSKPTIFLANEFFDAIPIKQFIKKKGQWFEKYVDLTNLRKVKFIEKKFDMKKFEKKINYKISRNQNIVEYSPETFKYLKDICKIIQKNNGCILIIDYGYLNEKMQDTLQAITNHKYSNVLENIGKSDITHNINFNLFGKFTKKFKNLKSIVSNQKKFLTNMGIIQRAEIITKNQSFSQKANMFYRVKRLIDEKQMGNLFKVMLITNKSNKFRIGF